MENKRTLRDILDSKISAEDRGVEFDCTEGESAEIKGYFRENWETPNAFFISLITYFPKEYGEVESEKE